jgi:hypothetical protein
MFYQTWRTLSMPKKYQGTMSDDMLKQVFLNYTPRNLSMAKNASVITNRQCVNAKILNDLNILYFTDSNKCMRNRLWEVRHDPCQFLSLLCFIDNNGISTISWIFFGNNQHNPLSFFPNVDDTSLTRYYCHYVAILLLGFFWCRT